MGFYDDEETAEQYVSMAKGYDGTDLIAELSPHLDAGASVLELGSGPGVDLNILSQNYNVTGSDNSTYFVERINKNQNKIKMLVLDAVTIATDQKFDAIFSNKVLHHLSDADLKISFSRQKDVLNQNGLILHSFWNGNEIEKHHGLTFHNRTMEKITELLCEEFSIIQQKIYSELGNDDSHWLLALKS